MHTQILASLCQAEQEDCCEFKASLGFIRTLTPKASLNLVRGCIYNP